MLYLKNFLAVLRMCSAPRVCTLVLFILFSEPSLPRLQEKHTREKLRDHLKTISSLQTELLDLRKKLTSIQNKIKSTHDRRGKLMKAASR